MSTTKEKEVVESVLSPETTKALWTSAYQSVFPFIPQDFSVSALLPTVFYMFRRGVRRGRGRFHQTFSTGASGDKITIERVVEKLLETPEWFEGFDSEIGRAILGDLLLTHCLENKIHKTGRTEEIKRVFPSHYFSSWIDLPKEVAHLRAVPEMMVALLADQAGSEFVERGTSGHFGVGRGIGDNLLLRLFGTGVVGTDYQSDLKSDRFDEATDIQIDQLLTVRLAQLCGESPQQARGKGEVERIANRRILSRRAETVFRDDFTTFLVRFGEAIPRQTLVSMLESAISINLVNGYLSTSALLLQWGRETDLPAPNTESPWPLFTDCSSSSDAELRRISEESMTDCLRRLETVPIVLMRLRVIEEFSLYEDDFSTLVAELKKQPHGYDLVRFLGKIASGRQDGSEYVLRDISKKCRKLAEALDAAELAPAARDSLRNESLPADQRLAEALILLIGDSSQRGKFLGFLDSSLMSNAPNGLSAKRRAIVTRSEKRRSVELRSIVLTDVMLDFLVHRYLATEPGLTFAKFLTVIREKYGLHIDAAPPGLSIPTELLLRNRRYLEQRLRNLGLLAGVNDAESMKRLRARFTTQEGA